MKTPTNIFLLSLAVSDISLLLVGLPNDLHVFWQQYPWLFGELVCKLRALISETTSNSSVLTIVAFSIERYIAICHPIHSFTVSRISRAKKILGVIWVISLGLAVPYAYYSEVHFLRNPHSDKIISSSAFCSAFSASPYLFEFSLLFFFIGPMIIMLYLYITMGFKLKNNNKQYKNKIKTTIFRQESIQPHIKKGILKMLAFVVFSFFICWAPFHAQRLLYVTHYFHFKFMSEELFQSVNEKLFYITGCFYYFSSTVNPILYNLLSVKYRKAFKEILCQKSKGISIARSGAPRTSSNCYGRRYIFSANEKRLRRSSNTVSTKTEEIADLNNDCVNKKKCARRTSEHIF